MKRVDVPVLIVGAGPVGLLTAILLARDGREALIVERRGGPQDAPAAHVINARTLEILRQSGIDMDAVAEIATDPEDGGLVRFMTSLDGDEVGILPFEQQGDDCLRVTPTPLRNISQHHLEPILVETLRSLPGVELRYGVAWESAEQDAEGVTSILRDASTGEAYEVRSQHLIAADGAGSRVRKWLGIEMEGPPRMQSFMMIHFEANLRPIVKDRPGILYWLLDPRLGNALIAHDIDRDWVYMLGFDPETESEADFDDGRCESLVRQVVGDHIPLRILHHAPWHMSCQVAERMRDGRVFLVGDAAHRFPPTGGLGLNSGVQDAHDLVWKLGAVADGWASEALLDTYEIERRPVARDNARQSQKNAAKLLMIPHALGLAESPTTERMQATLADPLGRKRVEEAIADQAEHFDMLGLQIGFAYDDGAIVPDGSEPKALANPVREYAPSSRPGARLPHAWIRSDGARRSTLDLVGTSGLTLITQGRHVDWRAALEAAGAPPVEQVRAGVDFEDDDGHWASVCELGEGGALLVRPDQHVAWRARICPAEPTVALQGAFDALGLRPGTNRGDA